MLDNLPLVLAQEGEPPPSAAPATPGSETLTGNGPGPGDPTAVTSEDPSRDPGPPPRGAPGDSLFGTPFFLIMLGALALMFIFSIRSQSKEKKKRQAMIEAIKKGDRVQTIGGILATVSEVREGEIVLKVDENANVKLHFSRSSIQSVVTEKEE